MAKSKTPDGEPLVNNQRGEGAARKRDERTLRQRLEDSPVWVVAGVAIAAWLAGIATYQGVLSAAKLTTISSERKEALEKSASGSSTSADSLTPIVWRMNLEVIVNDKTTPAWEGIVKQFAPITVGDKRIVPWTVEMIHGTKTSEGEIVVYWKPVAGCDRYTLNLAGSYREQIPIPDGGTVEQVWGVCGTSEQQFSRAHITESQKVDVRIIQVGGNERLPFFITIPLENGRPLPEILDVRTHLSSAEGVVLARARLE